MQNKVKAKVFKEIRSYKNMVLDWEEFMDDAQAMKELRTMSGRDVVKTMKEVWEEVKSID